MTVQYGTGPSFQSQCPVFPPPPAGYTAWDVDLNGPVPPEVQAHAVALSNDMTKPLGYTDTVYSGGVPLLVRVDAHPWTTDKSGNIVLGCFHGAEIWIPTSVAQATVQPPTQTGGGLLVASLVLGTIVSGLTIYDFVKRRKVSS